PSYSLASSFFLSSAPTPELYTLSLHDALPICSSSCSASSTGASPARRQPAGTSSERRSRFSPGTRARRFTRKSAFTSARRSTARSEEHTSELQSRENLVCRLLLEKKKK